VYKLEEMSKEEKSILHALEVETLHGKGSPSSKALVYTNDIYQN
jgi:hypothetical protein